MEHKTFEIVETKADADAGTFEATVSVFHNVDSVGDRVLPGAFTKTLAKWAASGDPVPVILSHNWQDPMAHIGVADPAQAEQTSKGLLIRGKLDIADNPVAKQVHRLMLRRSLREFSFGYTVPKGGQRRGKDGANELSEIDLVEVGPTLKGANPETELHAVKAALGIADPPDADEQRRAASDLQRDLEEERIPDVPSADQARLVELEDEVAETKRQLAEAKAQPTPPTPAELRNRARQASRVERDLDEEHLPDVPAPPSDVEVLEQRLAAAEDAIGALKARPAPPSDAELRRRSREAARLRRDLEEERIPEVPSDLHFAQERIDELKGIVDDLKAAPQPQTSDALRKAVARVEREMTEATLPAVPAADPAIVARLEELEQRLDGKAPPPPMASMAARMNALAAELESDSPPDPAATARRLRAMAAAMAGKDEDALLVAAVWSSAYVNDLPDSAFLYVEPGGSKDADGKTTPRSLRHFPYKDANGAIDLPHLRNALARIPQSSLSQAIKDRLTARAQSLLAGANKGDPELQEVKDQLVHIGRALEDLSSTAGKTDRRSVDPLRQQAEETALAFASDGESLRKPPKQVKPPAPQLRPLGELRREAYDQMLSLLGSEKDTP